MKYARTLRLLLPTVFLAPAGCGDPISDWGNSCGFVCPDAGILEGNASISGIASIDGFFTAVLEVRNAGLSVEGKMRAELDAMALGLGLETTDEVSLSDLAADVRGAIEVKLAQSVEGSLTIRYAAPECRASLEVAAVAAAECDVDAEPGTVSASCEGSCEIDASAQASCQADGVLTCSGTAPNLACSGTCSGACELEAAAACAGSCTGTCTGECTVCSGGECQIDGMGNVTNCVGSCSADCVGTCDVEAGATCTGRCTGTCQWDPGMAECEAGVTAKCEASASADVQCNGACEGEVVPPQVSAECQAQVEAKANASVECTPPALDIEFQFAASVAGDTLAQAEFMAWLNGFKLNFAGTLAAGAELEYVGEAALGLFEAAGGTVMDVAEDIATNGVSLKPVIGAGCAIGELQNVGAALDDTMSAVSESATAVSSVTAAVGG